MQLYILVQPWQSRQKDERAFLKISREDATVVLKKIFLKKTFIFVP